MLKPPLTPNADHWALFLSEATPTYAAVQICEMLEALAHPAQRPQPDDTQLVDTLEGEVIGNRELGYANGPAYERARAALLNELATLRERVRELENEVVEGDKKIRANAAKALEMMRDRDTLRAENARLREALRNAGETLRTMGNHYAADKTTTALARTGAENG